MKPLPRFAGTAIAILAMMVLMLEVALTRVFSVMTYNHFTYLIVGLALLGFGAAGTILTLSPRFRDPMVRPGLLADCAWLFGLATMLSFLAITKTSFDSMAIHEQHDFSQFFGLLMLLVLAAIPFCTGGLCIGYVVSKSGDDINRIYFCDLVGAGVGALLSVFAINHLGATTTVFGIAAAACLVAVLVGGRIEGHTRWRYPLTALAALSLFALTLYWDDAVPVPFERSKINTLHEGSHRWNVVARVDVLPPTESYANFSGALSRKWDQTRSPLETMAVYQDGQAPTWIVKLQGKEPRDVPILGYYLQGAPHTLRPGGSTLVIGPGGGVDVAIALHHGCPRVAAVEINPCTISYVRDTYRDFAGGLYNRPDVEVVCAEGRHFLTATDQKFDIIQLSGVDTFTALASGAYATSENYLYTREAIRDFLQVLTDDGVLSMSRWIFHPERETLRLAVTAREVLTASGVQHPDQHMLIVAAPAWEGRSPWADIMIRKRPFSAEEVQRMRAWAETRRFDVIYDPLLPYVAGGPYDALEGTSKYNPSGCAREFDAALRLPEGEFRQYINNYGYRIDSCSDDSPFFFNYYRVASLRHPFTPTLGGYPVTRLPLALMILLGCLAQIIVISGLFILWPMRSGAAELAGRRGAVRILLYFAAVGLGFIAVEIMLLQKLTVFLGGPVYSMAITLFSLLVFCGTGSFLAKKVTRSAPRVGGALILLLLGGTIWGTTWFLNHELYGLLRLSHFMRGLVAVVTMLPVGLFMGMPFPTGVRVAERLYPAFVPWGWCVNACATVLGSVAAVLVAMFTSFTTVLFVGIGLYAIALMAMVTLPAAPADSVPARDALLENPGAS